MGGFLEYISELPAVAEALAGFTTGILTVIGVLAKNRRDRIKTQNALMELWKRKYIDLSKRHLALMESDGQRRMFLIELKIACQECYDRVRKELEFEDI